MQVQGHRENGQLGDDEEIDELGQPRRLREAVDEEIKDEIEHRCYLQSNFLLYVSIPWRASAAADR
jgi:hypothetical protein